jgi:hypothetical protein
MTGRIEVEKDKDKESKLKRKHYILDEESEEIAKSKTLA